MAAIANALALMRFGGFHFGHFGGRGNSGLLLLIGVAFAAVLIWALARPSRNVSANN